MYTPVINKDDGYVAMEHFLRLFAVKMNHVKKLILHPDGISIIAKCRFLKRSVEKRLKLRTHQSCSTDQRVTQIGFSMGNITIPWGYWIKHLQIQKIQATCSNILSGLGGEILVREKLSKNVFITHTAQHICVLK